MRLFENVRKTVKGSLHLNASFQSGLNALNEELMIQKADI